MRLGLSREGKPRQAVGEVAAQEEPRQRGCGVTDTAKGMEQREGAAVVGTAIGKGGGQYQPLA